MTVRSQQPAFPTLIPPTANSDDYVIIGMTMRDYFAAAAFMAMLSDHSVIHNYGAVAMNAYEAADAMLAASDPKAVA